MACCGRSKARPRGRKQPGLRVAVSKTCPKCNNPMMSVHKFNKMRGKVVRHFECTNRRCRHTLLR